MKMDDLADYLQPYDTVDDDGEEVNVVVNSKTVTEAEKFLSLLPEDLPLPDVDLGMDGMVDFEWYREPRKVLVVSIGDAGEIFYAAIVKEQKYNGNSLTTETDWVDTIIKLIKYVTEE